MAMSDSSDNAIQILNRNTRESRKENSVYSLSSNALLILFHSSYKIT